MHELRGDIWERHEKGQWVVITTNGSVRHDGAAVMGRGVAREAAIKFPDLPITLGDCIQTRGNRVHAFSTFRLFAFPVKEEWPQRASMRLIEQSAYQLVALVNALKLSQVYMVRPGCGNGGLSWSSVKPLLDLILDSRFYVVEKNP